MDPTAEPDAPESTPGSTTRRGWARRLGLDRPRVALLCFALALGCGLALTSVWVLRQPDPAATRPAAADGDSGGLPPPRVAPLPAPSSEPLSLPLPDPATRPAEPPPPPPAPVVDDGFDRSGWERIGAAPSTSDPGAPPAGTADADTGTRAAAPRADASPAPIYPARALRRGEQGETLLSIDVDEDGRPRRVSVLRSSGSRTLDNAAASAVRRWRFEPALREGRAVPDTIEVPIGFSLN